MPRTQTSLVIAIALALACSAAGRASADFIELPASGLGVDQSAAQASASPRELRVESGYLELGYYAVHGATVQKQLARPADAGMDDSVGALASVWSAGLRGAPSVPALVGALSVLLVGMAVFVTRRTRRV
jgi:hypothetical protein